MKESEKENLGILIYQFLRHWQFYIYIEGKNACSLFDDKEDKNSKKLSIRHHNVLGQILLDTYTLLLNMLELSIKKGVKDDTDNRKVSWLFCARVFSVF